MAEALKSEMARRMMALAHGPVPVRGEGGPVVELREEDQRLLADAARVLEISAGCAYCRLEARTRETRATQCQWSEEIYGVVKPCGLEEHLHPVIMANSTDRVTHEYLKEPLD